MEQTNVLGLWCVGNGLGLEYAACQDHVGQGTEGGPTRCASFCYCGCQGRTIHTLQARRQPEAPLHLPSQAAGGFCPLLCPLFLIHCSHVPHGTHSLGSLVCPKHPQGARLPHPTLGLFQRPPVSLPPANFP